jgi:hypothetical protein
MLLHRLGLQKDLIAAFHKPTFRNVFLDSIAMHPISAAQKRKTLRSQERIVCFLAVVAVGDPSFLRYWIAESYIVVIFSAPEIRWVPPRQWIRHRFLRREFVTYHMQPFAFAGLSLMSHCFGPNFSMTVLLWFIVKCDQKFGWMGDVSEFLHKESDPHTVAPPPIPPLLAPGTTATSQTAIATAESDSEGRAAPDPAPDPAPEIAPEIAPEPAPEIAPEIAPPLRESVHGGEEPSAPAAPQRRRSSSSSSSWEMDGIVLFDSMVGDENWDPIMRERPWMEVCAPKSFIRPGEHRDWTECRIPSGFTTSRLSRY